MAGATERGGWGFCLLRFRSGGKRAVARQIIRMSRPMAQAGVSTVWQELESVPAPPARRTEGPSCLSAIK